MSKVLAFVKSVVQVCIAICVAIATWNLVETIKNYAHKIDEIYLNVKHTNEYAVELVASKEACTIPMAVEVNRIGRVVDGIKKDIE